MCLDWGGGRLGAAREKCVCVCVDKEIHLPESVLDVHCGLS